MNKLYVIPLLPLLLAACQQEPTPPAAMAVAMTSTAAVPHGLDPQRIARGAALYKAHCVACHGDRAQGAPDWSRKGPDGKYPPPPLDAQGHAWHHPMSMLVATVREGTLQKGGGMPPWKGVLQDEEIEAVLAYVQSLWPEETYKSWQLMDEKARAGQMHHH